MTTSSRRSPRPGLAFAILFLAAAAMTAGSRPALALTECPGIVEVEGISKVGIEGGQSCDASACPVGVGTLAGVVASLCNIGPLPVECGVCECCRADAADFFTGTEATLTPGGDEADWCKIGGRGRELGEAAVCLLRDLAQPARAPSLGGPGIHLSADIPIPVGSVTADQRIGLLEFTHDAGGTVVRGFHTTGYCLPGLGCIDGQTQTFTASLVQASGGDGACDSWTLSDPYKLDITADEQQFNLGVGVGPILIPVPVGAISVTPRIDYESNQQAVTSPWAGGNDATSESLCFPTLYSDATDPAQVSFAASAAGLDGGLVDGWQSFIGFGGRDPRISGAVWDPAGAAFPPRPDFDFSTARSTEEKRPGARFHGGLRVAYSLADILAALGIPASFPPFYLDDISVYVQSDVDAAVASQLQFSSRESFPDPGPDCATSPGARIRMESSLATAASLVIKAGFRIVFSIDLGFFEKTFRIAEEFPAVSETPAPQIVNGPVATAGVSTTYAPDPPAEAPGVTTFSEPSPTDSAAFIDDCLLLPPPPVQTPPAAGVTPGDPTDLAGAIQVPCNICVYLPDVITSACVPKSGVDPAYDCGLGVNGMACDDPNCENREVSPPVSANVKRIIQDASQAGLPPDRQWACDQVAKNGCMDLCTFDPYAEHPLGVVQSAVDLKGAVCRDGDGSVEPARPCASDGECDDANAGTDDTCSSFQCTHTPLSGGPCDDGMWCNGADFFVNGQCTGHAGNPCFAAGDCCLEDGDACVDHCPTSPCDGKAPNDACDDGSVCTVGDLCTSTDAGLQCRGTAALSCSSGDACLTSLCEDVAGVATCVDHDNGTCPRCGNGIVEAGETCDDGNGASGDGCDANCTPTACGNGVVAGAEACDDGNAANADGCDSNCTATACGNGVVTGAETCDDGNATSGDGCDANCTPTACGNGVRTGVEQCDDANAVNGDGCDNDCTVTVCTPLITTNCAVPHDRINFAKEVTGVHVLEVVEQAQYLTRTESEEPSDFSCLPDDEIQRTVWYRYVPPVDGYLSIDASGSRMTPFGESIEEIYVVGAYGALTGFSLPRGCFLFYNVDDPPQQIRVEDDQHYLIVLGAPPYVTPTSPESYSLELTLDPDPLVPASNIHVERIGDDVLITWDDLSVEETGYRVWRRNGVNDFSPVNVATLGANSESFLDVGAGADCGFRIYDVSVTAPGVAGDYDGGEIHLRPCPPVHDDIAAAKVVDVADFDDVVTHAPGATVGDEDVPMSCAFSPDLPLQHTVWYKVSPAADTTMSVNMDGTTGIAGWFTGIQVFRGTPSAGTRVACANSPNELVDSSIVDLAIEGGEDYWVEIGYAGFYAANFDITYAVSIDVAGGEVSPPVAPASLSAVRGSGFAQTEVTLTWDDPNGDETGYEVEVSTDGGGAWSAVSSTGANATTHPHVDASCLPSLYRVRALRNAEASAWTTSSALGACAPVSLAPGAVACQLALGKAAAKYTDARLAALQKCRNRFNAGAALFTDEAGTDPIVDVEACVLEFDTAASITKAGSALRSAIGKKCDDADLSSLSACAPSLDALVAPAGDAGCLVAAIGDAVDAMIGEAYGRTLAAAETAERGCQEAIAKAGDAYASAHLKAVEGCLADLAKGKPQFADKAKTIPVTTLTACAGEYSAAIKIAKAGAAARKTIAKPGKPACSDALVSSLASTCAQTVDGLVSGDGGAGCLLSGHVDAAGGVLRAAY